MRARIFLCVSASLWLVITMAAAGTWRVGQADVRIKCLMTIGGSFDAKTTALSGSLTTSAAHPPAFDGTLDVDLRTIDTGINLRNEHLREKYLEVDKGAGYDKAVLSEIDLKGLKPDAPEGKGSFTGSLMLHGVKKTVSGPVEVRKAGACSRRTAGCCRTASCRRPVAPRRRRPPAPKTIRMASRRFCTAPSARRSARCTWASKCARRICASASRAATRT